MQPLWRRILRWVLIGLAGLAVLLVLAIGALLVLGWWRRHHAAVRLQDANDPKKQPAAIRAIMEEDGEALSAVIGDKDALNTKSISGTTPLALAVDRSPPRVVEAMIRGGADPNATTMSGYTPLMNAVMSKSKEKLAVLVKNGANIDQARAGTGETALSVAICDSSPELVAMLLANGADPNAKNSILGTTPLHEAVISDDAEVVRLLLKAGADPLAPYPNMPGETAITIARTRAEKAQGEDKDILPEAARDEIIKIWELLRPYAK